MEKFTTLKKLKRKRKHGFLGLMRTHTGRNRILSRRAKGRKSLTI